MHSLARLAALGLTAAVLLLGTGCSTPEPKPKHRIGSGWRPDVERMLVMPVVDCPAQVFAEASGDLVAFQVELEAALAERGYRVLPAETYFDALALEAQTAGVDLAGGVESVDADALERVKRRTLEAVRSTHGVEALLLPSLVVRHAELGGTHATWDGRSQSMTPQGAGEREAVIGFEYDGTIGAISLRVVVVDVEGELLYEGLGGLHILQRAVQQRTALAPVPTREMFEPHRVRRAAELALGGLPPKNSTAPAP